MTTPAGWYPEPDGQQQRYWDGERWTEHVAPLAAPAGDATQASPGAGDATGAAPAVDPAVQGAAPSGGGRGKVVGGIAAAALVVAGGLFAWTQMSSADGGAGSPEEAIVALMDAVSDEDLVGIAETILPGERRTYADPGLEGLGHLQRWGVLADDFDTADVAGFDIEITDIETRTEAVADDVVNVFVSGTVGGSVDGEELPIGDLILDRTGELDPDELAAADEGDQSEFDDLMITAVREGDRWYVSAIYTAAEYARAEAGVNLPSSGVAPIGADSPEAAVDGFLDAATSFDLEAVVARLNPDEAQALQRYAPIFLPDAQAQIDDAVAESGVTLDVDVETEVTERDGIAIVTFPSFTLTGEADGSEFTASWADGCLVMAADGETEEVCSDDVSGTEDALDLTDTPAGDLTAIFDDMDRVGLVVAQRDGQWFVSPIRTYSETILTVMRAIDREELERVIAAFEDGSMVEWLEDQLTGSFAADFEGMLDDPALDLDDLDLDDRPSLDLPGTDSSAGRPEVYGDDPDLDALWDACDEGDMASCDDLYWSTGVGTEYEAFGETCGNRVTEPVYGACVVALGENAA